MAKKDSDLFDRLHRAGLRKQVAKQLSGTGEDATKKLQRAARRAAAELRVLADEIENRVPGESATAAKPPARAARTATKPVATKPAATRPAATKPAAAKPPARTATRAAAKPARTRRPRPATPPST